MRQTVLSGMAPPSVSGNTHRVGVPDLAHLESGSKAHSTDAFNQQSWLPAERFTQAFLGVIQNGPTRFRQVSSGAIDVEIQHRHGGLERRAFAPVAARGRFLQ